mgnify:FL=1
MLKSNRDFLLVKYNDFQGGIDNELLIKKFKYEYL